MPRLAANISLMFPQLPFADRFAAAAKAGFRYVEYQFPYSFGSAAEIAGRARDAGVEVVLHNLPAGDAAKGDRGIACLPDRVGEFREGVERAIEYAKAAGCPRLNTLAGIAPAGVAREKAKQTLVENLRYAAGKLKAAGLTLLTEPCNPRTIPGFFLNTSQGRHRGHRRGRRRQPPPAVRPVPHADRRGRPRQNDRAPAAAHRPHADRRRAGAQRAGHRARSTSISCCRHIDRLGYQGWIGAEYIPKGDTVEGLSWAAPYLK